MTLLLLGHCPAHPSSDVLKSKDGEIEDTIAPIQSPDQGIISACKAQFCSELPSGVVNSEFQVTAFKIMLKADAHSVGLVWKKITPTVNEKKCKVN
jgi:hypothetical protein